MAIVSPGWIATPLFLLVALAGRADEPASALASLPSQPGEHVVKIEKLGHNVWLELGPPAADLRWGRARGRSWCAKMAFAPDLHVAFLTGEGVHGWWNEENGRYMDDLWAYDILGHRWICAYPGADVKSLSLTLDRNGFETTADGQQLPVAQLGHAYQMTAYDTDLKRFWFVPCPAGYWEILRPRREKWLAGLKDLQVEGSPSPYWYDVASGRWNRRQTMAAGPSTSFGDVLEYIPDQKRIFLRDAHHEIWYYEIAKNAWEKQSPTGPTPPFGIDPTACYDTKRQRLYIGGGSYPVAGGDHALWIYDLRKNVWVDPHPTGKPCGGSNSYNTNVSTMTYDSVNDVVVLNCYRGEPEAQENPRETGIWIYHPAENRWNDKPLPFPSGVVWHCTNACYDPLLNVHVYHTAGDSRDDGTVWVWRYKAAE